MNNKLLLTTCGIATAFIFGTGLASQTVLAQDLLFPGASGLAPGVLKSTETDSQSASTISPGAEEKVIQGRLPGGGCIASINSPGNLFKQEPTTTDTNP